MSHTPLAVFVFASVALMPTEAEAFCRTSTCEPERQSCTRDSRGCIVDGNVLRWPDRCIEVGLDLQSAVAVGFDPVGLHALVETARVRWTNVDCGAGTRPRLCLVLVAACGPAEAAIDLHFRADTAAFAGSAVLAQSGVHFAPDGTIEHVRVEINAGDQPLTVGDEEIGYDLLATVIHELGHAIGLDHSDQRQAAMYEQPRYGELSGRTLSDDDRAAVCTVYPPTAEPSPSARSAATLATPECLGSTAPQSGCSAAGGSADLPLLPWLAVVTLCGRRRRSSVACAVVYLPGC